jgi:23S rRNA pseudouridine955/2504/2580 synthase
MDEASEGRAGGGELRAGPDDAGRRLDKVLRRALPGLSLSDIYACLRKGKIRVNGRKASPDLRLAEGDLLSFHASIGVAAPSSLPSPRSSAAEDDELASLADLLILATEDLLFINKPRGELSQDAEGGASLLAARVRSALAARREASLSFSPGPLHRLDRNTSGVLVFSRSAAGARAFTALLRERKIEKRYLALVDGEAREAAEWRDRIARDKASRKSRVVSEGEQGDEASASMRPLLSRSGKSLILVELHTGLTHQIRVQAAARAMPLSGDAKYGGSRLAGGYILHALCLGFPEPPLPDLPRKVVAPLPDPSAARLAAIFGEAELEGALARACE